MVDINLYEIRNCINFNVGQNSNDKIFIMALINKC